jgi:hypothetical protein
VALLWSRFVPDIPNGCVPRKKNLSEFCSHFTASPSEMQKSPLDFFVISGRHIINVLL